jgi:hypothetical protein
MGFAVKPMHPLPIVVRGAPSDHKRYESLKGEAMLERGTDQALAVDVLSLQALPSVGEVTQLGRRSRRRGAKTVNVCLVTLNHVLNDIDILNIFG